MSAQQQSGAHGGAQHTGGASSFPWKAGGVAGIGAYIAGYLVTFATIYMDLLVFSSYGNNYDFGWADAGMIFYNAQFVRLEYDGNPNTINRLGSLGEVLNVDGVLGVTNPVVFDMGLLSFPVIAYTGLVAFVIAGAGYLVANRAIPEQASVSAKMEAGMTVFAGYLPLAFLGSFVFETELESASLMNQQAMTANPDVFASVLIAGFLFPLVFGALGGYFAAR